MKAASRELQEKISELSKLSYIAETILSKCQACGTCVKFCPFKIRIFNPKGKAITIKGKKTCGGCSVCFKRCPQNAIRLIPVERK
jgi:Pyruvate/2-oxoacid:ferredoxin oxidoreductase delta subunit